MHCVVCGGRGGAARRWQTCRSGASHQSVAVRPHPRRSRTCACARRADLGDHRTRVPTHPVSPVRGRASLPSATAAVRFARSAVRLLRLLRPRRCFATELVCQASSKRLTSHLLDQCACGPARCQTPATSARSPLPALARLINPARVDCIPRHLPSILDNQRGIELISRFTRPAPLSIPHSHA